MLPVLFCEICVVVGYKRSVQPVDRHTGGIAHIGVVDRVNGIRTGIRAKRTAVASNVGVAMRGHSSDKPVVIVNGRGIASYPRCSHKQKSKAITHLKTIRDQAPAGRDCLLCLHRRHTHNAQQYRCAQHSQSRRQDPPGKALRSIRRLALGTLAHAIDKTPQDHRTHPPWFAAVRRAGAQPGYRAHKGAGAPAGPVPADAAGVQRAPARRLIGRPGRQQTPETPRPVSALFCGVDKVRQYRQSHRQLPNRTPQTGALHFGLLAATLRRGGACLLVVCIIERKFIVNSYTHSVALPCTLR